MTPTRNADRTPEDQAYGRTGSDAVGAQASEVSGPPPVHAESIELTINSGRVVACAGVAIAFLQVASFALQYVRLAFGRDFIYGLVPMFDVNLEANVPTWFQSVLLLCCAASLGIVAASARRAGDSSARHWRILAVGFVLMSLDEAAQVHDIVNTVAWAHEIRLPAALKFAWVIPAAIIVAVVGVAYVPFLRPLPVRTRLLAAAAGLIYVSGAVGFEALGGMLFDRIGWETLPSKLVVAAEETAEMIGAALLLYTVLDYQARRFLPITIRVRVGL